MLHAQLSLYVCLCVCSAPCNTGKVRGSLTTQPNGSVVVAVAWEAPFSGNATDEFVMVSPTEMHVRAILQMGAATVTYNTVYDRKQ